MSIPQEPNAVFYHPLDDASSPALAGTPARAWAPSAASGHLTGTVADALGSRETAGPSMGLLHTLRDCMGVSSKGGVALVSGDEDAGTLLVVANSPDISINNQMIALLVGYEGARITSVSDELSLGSAYAATNPCVSVMDSQYAVMAYTAHESSAYRCLVIDMVGWSAGSPWTMSGTTGGNAPGQIVALGSDVAFAACGTGGLPADGKCARLVRTGTALAPSHETTIGNGVGHFRVEKISSTQVLMAYVDPADGSKGKVAVVDADAGGITINTAYVFATAVTSDRLAMSLLTADTALMVYANSDWSDRLEAVAASVAGTVVTPGAPLTVDAAASDATALMRVAPDAAVALWLSGSPLAAQAATLTVSGTAVTATTPVNPVRPPDADRGENRLRVAPWGYATVGNLAWALADFAETMGMARFASGAEAEMTDLDSQTPDLGSAWKYGTGSSYDQNAIHDSTMVELADGKVAAISNKGGTGHVYLTVSQLEDRLGVWARSDWESSSAFLQNGQAHMAKLSDTEMVLVYRDGDDSNSGKARIATVSGFFDVAFGPEFPFAAGIDGARAAALDSTTFVVAYRDAADDNVTARLGKVSGTDITYLSEAEASGAVTQTNTVGVAALSAGAFVLTWYDAGVGYVAAGEVVAGMFLTIGSPAVIGSCVTPMHRNIAALDSSRAVLVYTGSITASGSGPGYAQVVSVSGTAATPGTRLLFCDSMEHGDVTVAALPDGRAVAVYKDTGLGGNPAVSNDPLHEIRVRGLWFSGTDVAPMLPATLATGGESPHTTEPQVGWALGLDWERAIVSYRDGNTGGASDSYQTHDLRVVAMHNHEVPNDPPAWGPTEEFSEEVYSDNAALVRVAALSPTSAVVTYIDGATGYAHARTVAVDGMNATVGPAKVFYTAAVSGDTQYLASWSIDSSRFLVCWLDYGIPRFYAKVGTVNGTDITFGVQSTVRDGMVYWPVCEKLASTKLVVAYRDVSDANHGTAKVATIDGLNVTFGPEHEFQPAGEANQLSFGLAALDQSTAVIAYVDGPSGNHGVAKVMSVNGTDITYGAAATFNATHTDSVAAAKLDSARVVVAHNYGGGDLATLRAVVGSIAGTDLTYGAPTTLANDFTGHLELTPATPASVVAVWSTVAAQGLPGQQKAGQSATLAVSGTTVVASALSAFQDPGVPPAGEGPLMNGPATLDPSHVVVAWRDENDGNKGKLRVGQLGVTYPTAVGATKLAFAAWTKEATAAPTPEVTTTSPPVPAAGPEHEVPNTDGGVVLEGVAAMSSDTFAVLYRYSPSPGTSRYYQTVVGTVSGDDITWGGATTIASGSSSSVNMDMGGIAALSATKVVVAYNHTVYNGGTTVSSRVLAGDLSGGAITFGAPHEFLADGWHAYTRIGVAGLDGATAVLCYRGQGVNTPRAMAVFVSGTSIIAWSPEAELGGTPSITVNWTRATRVSSTQALFTWQESSGGSYLRARVGFVTGGTVTLGSISGQEPVPDSGNDFASAVSALGDSDQCVFVGTTGTPTQQTRVLAVSGGAPSGVTVGGGTPAPTGGSSAVAVAGINSGQAIVGYRPDPAVALLAFRVADIVGTDATYGPQYDLDTDGPPARDVAGAVRLDDATAVFVYQETSGSGNLLRARVVSAP